MPSARTRPTRSSSTQPPDTEPSTMPSSRTASIAPGGRGELPHVLTTVTSSTRRSADSQSAHRFRTSRSTLSIVPPDRAALASPPHLLSCPAREKIGDDADDERDGYIADPRALRGESGDRRRGRQARLCRDCLGEALEKIIGKLLRRAVDETGS